MYWIAIDTIHYSDVVRAFLKRHPGASVLLNKHLSNSNPDKWCTEKELKSLKDFSLVRGEDIVLFYHGHPDNLTASEDELEFVRELASKRLLRFTILCKKPSFS